MHEFTRPSNLWATYMFVSNWLLIALAFVLAAAYPSPLTLIPAVFIIASRQLGLGILLHECSHRSFFSSRRLNDVIGHWLAGIPVLIPIRFYRLTHLQHHAKTGTDEDPDVQNIAQYPVTKRSLLRKTLRDFSGLSGVKVVIAFLLYVLPERSGNAVSMGNNSAQSGHAFRFSWVTAAKNYGHVLIFHGGFFALFMLLGKPWLYGLWWLSYVFVYPFIVRVRQIGEHAAMPALASADVRETTRTTLVRWWERCLLAPNYVNYHCEHHYLPTVPSYHLPKLHRRLSERGFYKDHPQAIAPDGYRQVLNLAMS